MELKTLVGKILSSCTVNDDRTVITFKTKCGILAKMYHEQDCCENVYIESIVGDLDDLIDTPILIADESTKTGSNNEESVTWTFYKLATINGYVDIRWYGSSNGYYSEAVSLVILENKNDTDFKPFTQQDRINHGLKLFYTEHIDLKYGKPGDAHTLDPVWLTKEFSGWKIYGIVTEDHYEWVNEFRAYHRYYGIVEGDFEKKVYATSKEAFDYFYENVTPQRWNYRDI